MRFLSIHHPLPPILLITSNKDSINVSLFEIQSTETYIDKEEMELSSLFYSFLARWMRINRESRLHNNPIKFAMHYQLPTPPPPLLLFILLLLHWIEVPCLILSPLLRFRCIHQFIIIYRLKDENGASSSYYADFRQLVFPGTGI